MSKLVKLYLVAGVLFVGAFAWWGVTGRERQKQPRRFIPADVRAQARTSPGGYRSFHFWHVGTGGYRGGK